MKRFAKRADFTPKREELEFRHFQQHGTADQHGWTMPRTILLPFLTKVTYPPLVVCVVWFYVVPDLGGVRVYGTGPVPVLGSVSAVRLWDQTRLVRRGGRLWP